MQGQQQQPAMFTQPYQPRSQAPTLEALLASAGIDISKAFFSTDEMTSIVAAYEVGACLPSCCTKLGFLFLSSLCKRLTKIHLHHCQQLTMSPDVPVFFHKSKGAKPREGKGTGQRAYRWYRCKVHIHTYKKPSPTCMMQLTFRSQPGDETRWEVYENSTCLVHSAGCSGAYDELAADAANHPTRRPLASRHGKGKLVRPLCLPFSLTSMSQLCHSISPPLYTIDSSSA